MGGHPQNVELQGGGGGGAAGKITDEEGGY